MKRFTMIVLLSFFGLSAFAQNCDFYMPFVKNKGVQYQSYSAKDKLTGSNETIVKDVKTEDGFLVATMISKAFDPKGKPVNEGEYVVKCAGNVIMIDIRSMIDPKTMAGFEGMEMKMEAEDMELPSQLSVGSTLKDARMKMTVINNGINFMEMIFEITSRKVEAKETITVPAGTYEVYKISYNTFVETKTMGIPIRVRGKAVEYFAKGVGSVKTETFDDKGRSQGYTVLSKIL